MSLNISAYAIKNPLVAILLFILLTMGGIFGFEQMKIQQFPDTDLPAVVVTITLSGAAPAQLENDVAKKVENKLASIDGIKHMRTTIQTGAVTVMSEFALEKNVQEALDDVRSAVGEIRGDLPATANDPIVSKVSMAGFPIATYSVASDTLTAEEISWLIDDTLSKRLLGISGVGGVSRVGGVEREISIQADPVILGRWQMPISQLANQVASLQQDLSGGELKIGDHTQSLRILGAVKQSEDLKDLQIALPMGGSQALSNMAKVVDGVAEPQSIAKLDGKTVVAFNVSRSRGASEVAVIHQVDDLLAQLQTQMPQIQIDKVYDRATPVYEDYQASMRMLI